MSTTPLFKIEDPGGGGGRSVWSLVSDQIERIEETEDLWGVWVAVLDTEGMSPQAGASRRRSIINTLEERSGQDNWEVVNRTIGHDEDGRPTIRTYVRYTPQGEYVGTVPAGDDTDDDWDDDE